MKRAREENVAGPQLKRPATNRGETSAPTQLSSGSQRLTTDDALAYLKAVKDMFKDKKEKYDEFLEVMKDFKAQRIDTAGVITRVKELFKGHRNLILGFNTFLPKGYEITLSPDEELPPKKQPVEFDQAINYVNKIKTRFQYDEQVYKAFLEILNMYRKGNKSIHEVYQEVAGLFQDHQDLLEEFTYFLPDSSCPAPIAQATVSKVIANSMPRRDEKTFGSTVSRHIHSEKNMKREQATISADHEWTSERPVELELEQVAKVEKEQQKVDKEKEIKDEWDLKERERDDKDLEQEREKDYDAMQRLPPKRKSARRADELIRKQSQGGEGGEAFVVPPAPTSSVEEKRVPKSLQKELVYFEKVKGRLRSHETYQDFLKCLNLYSEEIITRAQLQRLVDDLLGKYPDLVEGFTDFLGYCENIEGYLANVASKKFHLSEGPSVKPVKEEREREKDKEREREKDHDHERDRDKEREKDKITSQPSKVSLLPSKDKYMSKPISELDLSNCERCTPSYRLLPKNYPKPVASHHTDLAQSVLNDNWVSVTSGSEDYSFKHMRKNQYEESLFRCEDDRFELDMLLESTGITAKRVEELLEKMESVDAKQERQIRPEDCLTAINLRCVERIYGDHGLDVIDLLRKNASVALPVILVRLKQKQEEWSKCRTDMNKVWAEVYAKNYHKSLDHRSFYFKQQDKKSLGTKGLLAEVKEINEKKRKEDDVILSIAAGNRRPLISDLKFWYPDPSINEDLYRIIKYSADEMCTTMEQSDKIMRIWTTFLEPMFGVPPRSHGAEDTEEFVKVKIRKTVGSGSSLGDSDASAGIEGRDGDAQRLGSGMDTKHGTFPDDFVSASSKADWGTRRSGMAISAIANGEKTSVKLSTKETIVEDMERGMGKADPVSAGNLLSLNPVPDYTVPEASMNDRFYAGLEDSERRSNGTRREHRISALKLEPASLKCGRDESIQSGSLGKIVWCKFSPSPEVEDMQNVNLDHAENVLPVPENVLTGQILKDALSNKSFNNQQEDDEDGQGDGNAEGEHDGDADDEGEESAQKSSEDSENVFEAGEDVSGSESGEGDDGSHEDRDEEEDDDDEEHEGKAESEGEAEGIVDVPDAEGDGTSLACSDRSLLTCKPLAAHGPSIVLNSVLDKDSRVFYGNDTFYVLFRLHQTLYERILSAKINATAAEQKWKTIKDTDPPDLYAKFMRVLYNLLDGSADNAKFEDDCRAIIGTQSYVLFTLDKLIFKLVKQVQSIASDETAGKLLALYSYEKSRASSCFIDLVYHANACVLLHDENIYRIEHRSNPYRLSIQLMEGGPEKLEVATNVMDSSFSSYLNDFLLAVPDVRERHPIFLTRNKRAYMDNNEQKAMAKAMRNVQVVNGLEYKISCSTSKVSYVLDTEDFLHRRKRKRSANYLHTSGGNQEAIPFNEGSNTRLLKFHIWLTQNLVANLTAPNI